MNDYDLSVVIVNYNGLFDLRRCLASINKVRMESAIETIVVDNASVDGSDMMVAEDFKWAKLIRAAENLGFARGCNLGLAAAQGRHAMLLNPDTEVLPGALPNLIAALDNHPTWGIVGPVMVDAEDIPYRAARRFPSPFRLFCETTRLAFAFPNSRWLSGYYYGGRSPESLDSVDQIEGSALVINGAARKVVGDLDPQFFIYFEEVDWCKRVREAGFEIHVVREARIRHYRATTMSRHFLESRRIHAESAMKYFLKHHGERGLASLRRWMRAGLAIREMGMRIALFLGAGERARLRAKGARLEREVYRRGLSPNQQKKADVV